MKLINQIRADWKKRKKKLLEKRLKKQTKHFQSNYLNLDQRPLERLETAAGASNPLQRFIPSVGGREQRASSIEEYDDDNHR